MSAPKILSPAMLKTYKQCKKKYFLRYVKNIIMPSFSTPFEKGKKIHAIAGYSLSGIDISKFEHALNEQEKFLWERLKSNEYFKLTPVKTEFTLNVKLGDFWFGGRLDAIVKNNDEYFILDCKTGSTPDNPQYDYQTMVYLSALSKFLKQTEKLNFVYIDLKNNQNYLIPCNKNLLNEYEIKLTTIAKQISLINESTQCNCSNTKCEYSKICF